MPFWQACSLFSNAPVNFYLNFQRQNSWPPAFIATRVYMNQNCHSGMDTSPLAVRAASINESSGVNPVANNRRSKRVNSRAPQLCNVTKQNSLKKRTPRISVVEVINILSAFGHTSSWENKPFSQLYPQHQQPTNHTFEYQQLQIRRTSIIR
jgi:hypothetical protein